LKIEKCLHQELILASYISTDLSAFQGDEEILLQVNINCLF